MGLATNQVLNDYARALGVIENLEKTVADAIRHLKSLKSGELTLDRVVVTDGGWEIMPPAPVATPPTAIPGKNGHKGAETLAGVAGGGPKAEG